MKKLAVIVCLGILTATFPSCRKDYVCTCTTGPGGSTITYTKDLGGQKRKSALNECKSHEGSSPINGVTYKINCRLN